jgi:WD40 repeat protein
MKYPGHFVTGVAFSPDPKKALLADFAPRLIDLETGAEDRVYRTVPSRGPWCALFVPGSKAILYDTDDFVIQMVDGETADLIKSFNGHTDAIKCLAVSADGKWLVSGSLDKTLRLWSVRTGKEVHRHDDKFTVYGVAVGPGGNRVYAGFTDGSVGLWDGDLKLLERKRAHALGAVFGLAVSPDGKRVLSGGYDGKVVLSDAETLTPRQVFVGHEGPVRGVAFLPGGRQAVSASEDGTVRLWQVPP